VNWILFAVEPIHCHCRALLKYRDHRVLNTLKGFIQYLLFFDGEPSQYMIRDADAGLRAADADTQADKIVPVKGIDQ